MIGRVTGDHSDLLTAKLEVGRQLQCRRISSESATIALSDRYSRHPISGDSAFHANDRERLPIRQWDSEFFDGTIALGEVERRMHIPGPNQPGERRDAGRCGSANRQVHGTHFGGACGALGSMLRMAAMRQPSAARVIRKVLHMRRGGAPARPAIS